MVLLWHLDSHPCSWKRICRWRVHSAFCIPDQACICCIWCQSWRRRHLLQIQEVEVAPQLHLQTNDMQHGCLSRFLLTDTLGGLLWFCRGRQLPALRSYHSLVGVWDNRHHEEFQLWYHSRHPARWVLPPSASLYPPISSHLLHWHSCRCNLHHRSTRAVHRPPLIFGEGKCHDPEQVLHHLHPKLWVFEFSSWRHSWASRMRVWFPLRIAPRICLGQWSEWYNLPTILYFHFLDSVHDKPERVFYKETCREHYFCRCNHSDTCHSHVEHLICWHLETSTGGKTLWRSAPWIDLHNSTRRTSCMRNTVQSSFCWVRLLRRGLLHHRIYIPHWSALRGKSSEGASPSCHWDPLGFP